MTSEIDKDRMDLVGVQEIRWEGSGTLESANYTLFYGGGNTNHQVGTRFFVHRRLRSAVRKVEFISDRVSCITLKGRWSDIIVLNVHDLSEDNDGNIKDSFMKK